MNTFFKLILMILAINISIISVAQENQNIETIKLTNSLTEIIFKENIGGYISSVVIFTGNDGILMIDNGAKESYPELLATIKSICDKPLKYIILTHWHFDHTNGDSINAKEVTLFSHTYTRELLSKDQILMGMNMKANPYGVLPQITIEAKTNFYLNNDTVEVIPLTGGHSGGDLIVYFKHANVLHVGDLVFSDMFPFYDTDHGGNVFKAIENIQKIIETMPADIRIIPSHGSEYNMNDLKAYKKMLVETSNLVKKEMKKGKSLEILKKENVLKDYSKWAIGFTCEDWIEFIYKSVKK
jgi:cyclase